MEKLGKVLLLNKKRNREKTLVFSLSASNLDMSISCTK